MHVQVTGIVQPLTNRSPATHEGKLITIIFAVTALSFNSVVIGMIGAMAICKDFVYMFETKLGEIESAVASPARELCAHKRKTDSIGDAVGADAAKKVPNPVYVFSLPEVKSDTDDRGTNV